MEKFLIKLSELSGQKVLFFGALAGAIYYFMSFNDGSGLKEKIATQKATLQQEQELEVKSKLAIAEEKEIQRVLVELKDQFKIVSQQLPSKVEPAEMSRDVDEAASLAGLGIKQKTPGQQRPSKLDVLKELPVAIEASGSFSEVARFLNGIGTMSRIMKVKDFSLVNTDPKNPGLLVFRGEIVSYLFSSNENSKGPKK